MPFIKTIFAENVRIGIWLMQESSQELAGISLLSENERLQMEMFPAEKRKREYLAVRLLLSRITGGPSGIKYNRIGQPVLENGDQNITISHSGNMAVILLSGKSAGIDVEMTGRNISNIAPRFLSPEELLWTSDTGDPSLAQLYCWCSKEAIYKMMGLKHLEFKKEILMTPVVLKQEGEGSAVIKNGRIMRKIDMHYFTMENNLVTWCIDDGTVLNG